MRLPHGGIILCVALGKQAGVAPGGSNIHGHDLLGRKAPQRIGTAGLWSGPRQAAAPERLRTHHGADHVAVHVDIAMGESCHDALRRRETFATTGSRLRFRCS